MSTPPRSNLRFSILGLFFALTALAALFSVIHYVNSAGQRKARYNMAQGMRWALYGIERHDDSYLRLPGSVITAPTGKPLSSWRFAVSWHHSSGIQHVADYRRAWNVPPNDSIASDPTSGGSFCVGSRWLWSEDCETNVMAITGTGTAFDNSRVQRWADLEPDQIVLVEVSHSGTHWMAPRDIPIDKFEQLLQADSGCRIGGTFGDGFHIGFADGEVWYIRSDTPYERLAEFLTGANAQKSRREDVLGPHVLAIERERKWLLP